MNPRIDEITEVPCAACGQPIRLTWTKSAEGWGIWCGTCWEAKQ